MRTLRCLHLRPYMLVELSFIVKYVSTIVTQNSSLGPADILHRLLRYLKYVGNAT